MKSVNQLATIDQALDDLRNGKMIILVDDENRENEGDLVMAAEFIQPQHINFMSGQGRGLICLALNKECFERLEIPMMVKNNNSFRQTAFGISFDAASGVTTGISAADRAHTIQTAINPNSKPSDVVMPGHLFPLCAAKQGVIERAGHTEGSVDLMRLAGLKSAGVICEIMNEDGSMARFPDLVQFGNKHQLKIISIADLIIYRMQHESFAQQISSAVLPIRQYGQFDIYTFKNFINQMEEVAIVRGPINKQQPVLVRIHSECLTGDVFGSSRCDCGQQFEASLQLIAEQGGVLLYMRQEGRGIGLANKIKAYHLQDQGLDTVEANHQLGFAADQRDYGVAAQMLKNLGVTKVRMLTNNPNKISEMAQFGIEVVERVPLMTHATPDNIHYLKAKRDKLGHFLSIEQS